MTYLALFYDILTLNNFAGNYHVALANVPALLISIAAVINFIFFRKVAFLSDENVKSVKTGSKIRELINNLYKTYINRLKSNFKLLKYSLTLNGILLLGFILYCMINFKTTLFS